MRRSKTIVSVILLASICAAAALAAARTSLIQSWELKTYDLRMRLDGGPADDRIALVYVDEPSLRHMESLGVGWPWPRELYAKALEFLKLGQAKAAFFDIIYSEASVYGVGDDLNFGRGIAVGPPSYFAVFASAHDSPADERAIDVIKGMSVPMAGSMPGGVGEIRSFPSLPIPEVLANARGFANVQSRPDADGVFRRVPLATRLSGSIIPSPALKLTCASSNNAILSWPRLDRAYIGGMDVPLDENGSLLIRFPESIDSFPTYSLGEILAAAQQITDGMAPQIAPDAFKDKIVIFGLSAPGLMDLKPSPIAAITPGPFIHAAALNNLLLGNEIAALPVWLAALCILMVSIVAAAGLTKIVRWWGMLVFVVLLFCGIIAGAFFAFHMNVWAPLVAPLMAGALSSTSAVTRNYLTEGRRRVAIKRAFSQYLSPEVVDLIAKDPENVRMDGTRQGITIFFSDIAGFTTLSEATAPEELVSKLNEYLTSVTGIILEQKGTLDKYIGDAVMAFWGAPLSIPDHASRATHAALAIQRVIEANKAFKTRIGIHTGQAVVGNIGSEQRFNYTAIGDCVNLASRLEGLNKYFGTSIVVSESTKSAAGLDIFFRSLGHIRVKGRSEPVQLFEPMGLAHEITPDARFTCEFFASGIEALASRNIDKAYRIFRDERLSRDKVTPFYTSFCERIIKEGSKDKFDGVITFETK